MKLAKLALVPVLFCLGAPPAARAEAVPELPDNPAQDVRVDWRRGALMVFAAGIPSEGASGLTLRRQEALKTAWSEAQEKLSRSAHALPFDAGRRISGLIGGSGPRKAQRGFRAFLASAGPARVYLRRDQSVGLWIAAPLYGREGLGEIGAARTAEGPAEPPAAVSPAAPGLLLQLTAYPPEAVMALWPVIYAGPDKTARWADLPALASEGLLPPDFRVYRVRREDLGVDPTLPKVDAGRALSVVTADNGVDYVLDPAPGGMEKFNPYAWSGLVIAEP